MDDDGDGIDPKERALVGERGERLDKSIPGSGLGLAIVHDIARLYGGALTIDDSRSAASKRGCFWRRFA